MHLLGHQLHNFPQNVPGIVDPQNDDFKKVLLLIHACVYTFCVCKVFCLHLVLYLLKKRPTWGHNEVENLKWP